MRPRPLSPHLQIYHLPPTGLLSILHRVTGVVLSLGLLALVGMLVILSRGWEYFDVLSLWLHTWMGKVALWLWLFALAVHFAHGTRHLLWDAGAGFAAQRLRLYDRVEIVAIAVLTVVFWAAAAG